MEDEKLNLYEVSQTINYIRYIRVKAKNEEEAEELARHENYWNELDGDQEEMCVELIELAGWS